LIVTGRVFSLYDQRMGFAGFTDRELKMIDLRTHGVKTPEIARRLGMRRTTAYDLMWRIYLKVGVDDVALLTRWAIEHAMDEPLAPERPEDIPKPEPKVFKKRIKLNRIRRH
jgi:DNA-binding CsgD family transcriptional regulator